jgi:hypothetical protein
MPGYNADESQGCFNVGPDCYVKVLGTFAPWKLAKADRDRWEKDVEGRRIKAAIKAAKDK